MNNWTTGSIKTLALTLFMEDYNIMAMFSKDLELVCTSTILDASALPEASISLAIAFSSN